MHSLDDSRRAAVLRSLLQGNSIRTTALLTTTAKATVLKLLVDAGEFCSIYQDHTLRDLKSTRIEADEVWAFVGSKERNAPNGGQGDIWTYTAIDADSKLVLSWLVAPRNSENKQAFLTDVAERLAGRAQVTTDGLDWSISAVVNPSGWNATDYTQIVKTPIMGTPNEETASTSYVERRGQNLRIPKRRFSRLTSGYSKKAENHARAVSLFFMFYNYCRPHPTLTTDARGIETTPAMAAGVTDHTWTVEEILAETLPANESRRDAGVTKLSASTGRRMP